MMSMLAALLLQKWTLPLLLFAGLALPAAERGSREILDEPLELPPAASAAPGTSIGDTAEIGGALLSIAFATMLVVGLMVALAWLYKRYGKRFQAVAGGRHLEVLENLPMGLKRSVSLLRCGDKVLVVGMSEQGMHALGEIGLQGLEHDDAAAEQVTAEDPVLEEPSEDAAISGFKQRLEAMRGTEA